MGSQNFLLLDHRTEGRKRKLALKPSVSKFGYQNALVLFLFTDMYS